jgi:hypothetical protein
LYFTVERDKDNNFISVTISSTIYITGNTTEKQAVQLTKEAKSVFTEGKTMDGKTKINFDIKYEYVKNPKKDLGAGNNLLTFSYNENVVNGVNKYGLVNAFANFDEYGWINTASNNEGTIWVGASNKDVFHESGHLVGLSDPYNYNTLEPNVGFEKNLMSNKQVTGIHQVQYELIGQNARLFNTFRWISRSSIPDRYLNNLNYGLKTRFTPYNQEDFGLEIKIENKPL